MNDVGLPDEPEGARREPVDSDRPREDEVLAWVRSVDPAVARQIAGASAPVRSALSALALALDDGRKTTTAQETRTAFELREAIARLIRDGNLPEVRPRLEVALSAETAELLRDLQQDLRRARPSATSMVRDALVRFQQVENLSVVLEPEFIPAALSVPEPVAVTTPETRRTIDRRTAEITALAVIAASLALATPFVPGMKDLAAAYGQWLSLLVAVWLAAGGTGKVD